MKANLILKNASVYTVDKERNWGQAIAIADDRIVFVGFESDGNGINDGFVALFTSDGTLDNSFNENGWITTDIKTMDRMEHMAVQTDGKIIIAGEDEVKKDVVNFLEENQNPSDDKFHQFAEELGVDVHELESKAYEIATQFALFLNNGRANEEGITKDQVDPKELEMGIEVEKEHTTDEATAERISLDHLAEEGLSDYYTRLKKMEDEAKQENA